MAASASPSSAVVLVALLLATAAASASAANETRSFRPGDELRRYRRVQALLRRLNKPALRTIQSPDGDLIDCVATHLQPAFDHPRLRGQRPLDPPVRPKGHHHRPNPNDTADAGVQLWAASGESCPEGSVPIRRITEADVLRASSVRRFGRAPAARVRRDSVSGGHEVPRGGLRGRRRVLRRQGEHQRVGAQGEHGVGVQPVADLGHRGLLRQRPQHHRGRVAGQPAALRRQLPALLHLLDHGRVPDHGLLQPPLLRLHPDQQPHRHGRRHIPDLRLQRRPVRHQPARLEGPQPRQLVAGVRLRRARGVLAVAAVQPPGVAREHGAVRRRGGEHARVGVAHGHADGQRALRRRGLRPGLLLPEPGGGGLGQQPRAARRRIPRHRRPPQLLRHPGRRQRRLGELLLLRRAGQERQMHVAAMQGPRGLKKNRRQAVVMQRRRRILFLV